jgi:MFS family permease
MSDTNASPGGDSAGSNKVLFWGCFIALVTTAFGFITRLFLIGTWAGEFKLDPAQAGKLAGIGIWPFAVSIIAFSLFIDKIGYKAAMIMAFVGHIIWTIMGISAYFVSHGQTPNTALAYDLLYWGSLILGLANGTVEAFINPVVATMFNKEKPKWLNILHAGWPGGLVIAGIIVIFMGQVNWGFKVGIIGLPAIVYFLILIGRSFPRQERVEAGVSTKDMLSEFGVLGAAIVGFLVTLQLMDFWPNVNKAVFVLLGVAIVAGFGAYTKALGRPLMFFLCLVMIPLATTEIGTDGWITAIMEGVAKDKFHPGWILVYTSVIMMILRFFAGPILHKLSPLGLLTASSALAIGGLFLLSSAAGVMIFVAATLYALGKTFFWPTMLGVVSEQTPKGGALTLNAISGLGMLAVGTLGFPYIGALQADKAIQAVVVTDAAKKAPGLVVDGKLTAVNDKAIYEVIKYHVIDDAALGAAIAKLPPAEQGPANAQISSARGASAQGALGNMVVFPLIMLASYVVLLLQFKAKGGYKPVELVAAQPVGAK